MVRASLLFMTVTMWIVVLICLMGMHVVLTLAVAKYFVKSRITMRPVTFIVQDRFSEIRTSTESVVLTRSVMILTILHKLLGVVWVHINVWEWIISWVKRLFNQVICNNILFFLNVCVLVYHLINKFKLKYFFLCVCMWKRRIVNGLCYFTLSF